MYWDSTCGRVCLQITKKQAASCYIPGWDATDAVVELMQHPGIKRQLSKLDPEIVRVELKEYGAWSPDELADDQQNLIRVLWLACCDINEGF